MSNQNQLNLRECLPIKGGITKAVVILAMLTLFQLFAFQVTEEHDGSVGAMVSVLGFVASYLLYILFFREEAPGEAPLHLLKRLLKGNVIGYKLVARHFEDTGTYLEVLSRKNSLKTPVPMGPVIVLSLGGWFHRSRVELNLPKSSVFRDPAWVVQPCHIRVWDVRDPMSVWVKVGDPIGSRCILTIHDALQILGLVHSLKCDSISGAVGYLLGEAEEHNERTTRLLLQAVMKTSDELANTSRVGRSKEGKEIRERLDRISLAFLEPGTPEHERISRRL